MDFSKINSINDLISENDKTKNEGDIVMELCKPVFQEDPDVGLQVTITILSELLELHDEVMKQAVKDGESSIAANWAIDLSRIDTVLTLLKEIQM